MWLPYLITAQRSVEYQNIGYRESWLTKILTSINILNLWKVKFQIFSIFYIIRNFLDSKILFFIYVMHVFPNVTFNITVWDGAAVTRLKIIWSETVRTFKFASHRASANTLYVSLEMSKFWYNNKNAVGNYTFKSVRIYNRSSAMYFRSFT